MMKKLLPYLCLTALLYSTTGCVSSYPDPRTRKVTQEREDMLILKENIRRVEGQVEGLQMEVETVRRDTDQARFNGNQNSQQETAALRMKIDELERRIAAMEGTREKDKQAIISTLTSNMSSLLEQQKPARSPSRASKPRKPSSGYVFEHQVESGQTLSEIGRAYDVSIKTIMDENGLKNANSIRVGQILYIPE